MVTCVKKHRFRITSKKATAIASPQKFDHCSLFNERCSCLIQMFLPEEPHKTNPYCQLHSDCFNIIPISRECIGTRVQRFIHTHSEESEGIISEDADTHINPNLYCSVRTSWHLSHILRSYPDNFLSFAMGRQCLKYILEPCLRNLILKLHETTTSSYISLAKIDRSTYIWITTTLGLMCML